MSASCVELVNGYLSICAYLNIPIYLDFKISYMLLSQMSDGVVSWLSLYN